MLVNTLVLGQELKTASYEDLKNVISELEIKNKYKSYLLRKVQLAEKIVKKSKASKLSKKLETIFLRGLEWQLWLYNKKSLITKEEYKKVVEIINKLN